MGANKSATIVPGHGTLFVADFDAELPDDPLEAFTLTGAEPDGWTNVGHTSKGNQPAFAKEGGDATVLDTWLADNVDVVYAAEQWSLGVNALQVDQTGLDLGFGGFFDTDGGYVVPASNPGLEKQTFLLATDGTGDLGFWMPNTSTKLGDAPSMDASNFFEIPLSSKILSADESLLPANENGTPGIMKIFKTGLAAALPKIKALKNVSGAVITTAPTGTQVVIEGSGFDTVTGAAGVKFGATNAASYYVVSATKIIAQVAGSAGSAPVKVHNPTGDSSVAAFTIS